MHGHQNTMSKKPGTILQALDLDWSASMCKTSTKGCTKLGHCMMHVTPSNSSQSRIEWDFKSEALFQEKGWPNRSLFQCSLHIPDRSDYSISFFLIVTQAVRQQNHCNSLAQSNEQYLQDSTIGINVDHYQSSQNLADLQIKFQSFHVDAWAQPSFPL